MSNHARNVLITGVSSGIGHGMATAYLDQGWRVFGVSRTSPVDLESHVHFAFGSLDLTDARAVGPALDRLLEDAHGPDLVILNAGVLGEIADMADTTVEDSKRVMDINLWSNKRVLDHLFQGKRRIEQVVTMSSGASVNGSRGWGTYSISKAALNMLTRLYAREREETHFCALAPGLVESKIQDHLASLSPDPRYPSLEIIREKRGTADMPSAKEAGRMLARIIARLPEVVESGQYADIRDPAIAG